MRFVVANRATLCLLFLSALLLVTGCSFHVQTGLSSASGQSSLTGLAGVVHGGQQPVGGAHVYVFAAGTAAYGGSSVSLLNDNGAFSNPLPPNVGNDGTNDYIITDSSGSFSITGDYTCTSGQQVYLYASGGNPGAGANPAVGLMAVLGQCPSSGTFAATIPFVVVNEVTTIAAAYALAGFASSPTKVSDDEAAPANNTGAQAQAGMANAFANASNLANPATGAALATTPAGNGTVPQAEIDTLADILASCVNAVNSGGGCPVLFAAATSDGTSTGTAPADTATAAINIAHNPGAPGITALVSLQSASSPFQPTLTSTSAPNDFTLGLAFSGGGMAAPSEVAIDGLGNVWVTNPSTTTPPTDSVTKLSSLGAILSGPAGYTGGGLNSISGIAIDQSNDVWLANYTPATITELSNAGAPISGASGYGLGGCGIYPAAQPSGIAINGDGNPSIASSSAQCIVTLSASGTILLVDYNSGINDYFFPSAIALADDSGPWTVTSRGGGNPTVYDGLSYVATDIAYPSSIALDGAGNVWVGTPLGVTELGGVTSTGRLPNISYAGGGLGNTSNLSIDGSGTVWTADKMANSVGAVFSSGGLLPAVHGYTGTPLNSPQWIATDGSGNAWIANSGSNDVVELIGTGAPVITPIAAGLASSPPYTSRLGTRP